jgi:hypothetical protein
MKTGRVMHRIAEIMTSMRQVWTEKRSFLDRGIAISQKYKCSRIVIIDDRMHDKDRSAPAERSTATKNQSGFIEWAGWGTRTALETVQRAHRRAPGLAIQDEVTPDFPSNRS